MIMTSVKKSSFGLLAVLIVLCNLSSMASGSALASCNCTCNQANTVNFCSTVFSLCNTHGTNNGGLAVCSVNGTTTSSVCGLYTLNDCSTATTDCTAFCNSATTTGGGVGDSCTGTVTCADISLPFCFPSSASVQLQNGSTKNMSQLQVGDIVLVAPNRYSEVYMFSHKDEDATTTFVKISTLTTELRITSGHYLYVNGKLAVASSVVVGDSLIGADGSQLVVTAVSIEHDIGLFNPHTMDGDIVVNGIITSTYTNAIAPWLAHAALWPVRTLYNLGYDVVDGNFDQGSELITGLLPDGAKRY